MLERMPEEKPGIKVGGYGMVFETIWESSLAENWQAAVTFMVLLSIADGEDNVYKNLDRLHRKTGIPKELLKVGLEELLKPDKNSRRPEAQGRRITYLEFVGDVDRKPTVEDCRGWHIVNRAYYRRLLRKRYNTKYVRMKREVEKGRPTKIMVNTDNVVINDVKGRK